MDNELHDPEIMRASKVCSRRASVSRDRRTMSTPSPDEMILDDNWSDLTRYREMPAIDFERMLRYRVSRIRSSLRGSEAAMCMLVSPISLRYAVDYRSYSLFQSHVPTAYLFVSQEGPTVIHSVYGPLPAVDEARRGRPISFFDGGSKLGDAAKLLAGDIVNYLKEIGTSNRRVAVEYVNPSITQALMQRGLEVTDGVAVAEEARLIKSEDEIACMRWAIAVAELGISKIKEALRPGLTELQLWGLLNYTNMANNGDWHEGRSLVSGPRTNPWLQGTSPRCVESGDLVGLDTDMIGPFGYCVDMSRTFHCGPDKPTTRQKQLYRFALREIEHNLTLIRAGTHLSELQQKAYLQPEEFHEHTYPCIIHGVGMCDEYPRIDPVFRSHTPYDDTLQAGMVLCVESFVGAVGEPDGIKLEEQVLVTEDGYEMLTAFPPEERLLD